METGRKRLPLGIQVFEKLINNNLVYVDKTRYLIDLIEQGELYFFTRPRRFGKTLTISTFEALFQGRKELFRGLYAEEWLNRADFQPSHVIRLDMSKIATTKGVNMMEKSIFLMLTKIAKKHDLQIVTDVSAGDAFGSLIADIYEKYNSKVVILIDEYDKPLLDNLFEDKSLIKDIKNMLRNFYIQIKSNEECVRFVFLTGISKIARVGVFSTLNNITDVSFNQRYGQMCGYTEEEIKTYFPDYLQDTANAMQITTDELMEKMRHYYDGFCFDGVHKLYNPYSTLLFFENQNFANYWFSTGTPSVIANYLKDRHLTVEQFRNFPISMEFAENPVEIDNASPENFLYQSGYLTLREGTTNDYSLDYPNTEVLNSMSSLLTSNIVGDDNYESFRNNIRKHLLNKNKDGFKDVLNMLLSKIPYDDYAKAAQQVIQNEDYKFPAQEWLYRSTILSFLQGCGVVVEAELHTFKGRPDLVISYRGSTFILEFKVAFKTDNVEAKLTEAATQIREKEYSKPYPDAICLAMVIDDTQRQIVECAEV